jgi:predicted helicase
LDVGLIKQIEVDLGMKLDKLEDQDKLYDLSYKNSFLDSDIFSPVDLLDYIYAVLHSPSYREKYQEFLKIDFPRVPFNVDQKRFWRLVEKGGQLRKLHLLEDISESDLNISFPETERADNLIETKFIKRDPGFKLKDNKDNVGRLYINDEQYFDNVPEIAWNFYIGGYQPAQKWLKDRIGRTLSYDDLQHYRKIIYALANTDRIMKEIDKIKSDW